MWKFGVIVCLLASALPAQTQTQSGPSFETLTDKGWVLMMSDIMKSTYVKGFQDAVAVVAAGLSPEIRDSVRDNYIAKGFTVGDYVHELECCLSLTST